MAVICEESLQEGDSARLHSGSIWMFLKLVVLPEQDGRLPACFVHFLISNVPSVPSGESDPLRFHCLTLRETVNSFRFSPWEQQGLYSVQRKLPTTGTPIRTDTEIASTWSTS